jgi:hypothetical protein
MKAKIYERHYKLGFDHLIFKEVMGLKKPRKGIKRFYFVLIFVLLFLGLLLF